jgi:hypothetical protein
MFTSDGPAQPLEEEKNPWYKSLKKTKEKIVSTYKNIKWDWVFSIVFSVLYILLFIKDIDFVCP